MLRAFAQTDRKPQDVDFLELHATGMFTPPIICTQRLILLFSQGLPPEIPRRPTGLALSSSATMNSHWAASRATSGTSKTRIDIEHFR